MTKQTDPFYKSARWKKLRERILRRDGYMCQLSKRYGVMRQAQTVHHIFPRDLYPQYEWCAWNLISLTHDMHNRLHARGTDELTEEGKALLTRVAREHNILMEDTTRPHI